MYVQLFMINIGGVRAPVRRDVDNAGPEASEECLRCFSEGSKEALLRAGYRAKAEQTHNQVI